MIKNDCKKIIFSSSAAIYGKPNTHPITESFKLKPINPYGFSKLMVENLLSDMEKAYNFKYISLRYFNASGASNKFGEMHNPETHLIPLIMQVASGRIQNINIYGNKYKTKDGTCIRDYIHVADIADAHVKSVQYLFKFNKSEIFNLGSEGGRSVGEIIKLSRKITNKKIKVKILPKRLGDPSILIASSFKIKKTLKWKPKFSSIKNILQSAWNWEKKLLSIKKLKI
jgi:UDP-glucose 4-epimerase